jgi:ABC-type branched-subunit amino acid transport system substrate-binding protein
MICAIISILIVGALVYQGNIKEKTIRVGAVLPLTGRFAFMGTPIKNAMDLAASEINSSGGVSGENIEIIYSDSQGDPKTGVSGVQKMIDIDKIKIITTFLTGVANAIKPVTEENQTLLIAQTVSPTIVAQAKYTIRMHYSFIKEGQLLSELLVHVGQEPIGFIRSNDPSTSFEVEKVIIPNLKSNKLNKIIDETFDVGNKDFKAHVLKMKQANVKQLCILGYGSDFPNLLREANAIGLLSSTKLCGNLGFIEIPKDTPKELIQNAVFTVPPFLIEDQKSAAVKDFEKNYRSAFSVNEISYSAYYAYDTIKLLKLVLEYSSTNKVHEIRKALSTNTFKLMTGNFQFSSDGDFDPPAVLAEFENGNVSVIRLVRLK